MASVIEFSGIKAICVTYSTAPDCSARGLFKPRDRRPLLRLSFLGLDIYFRLPWFHYEKTPDDFHGVSSAVRSYGFYWKPTQRYCHVTWGHRMWRPAFLNEGSR